MEIDVDDFWRVDGHGRVLGYAVGDVCGGEGEVDKFVQQVLSRTANPRVLNAENKMHCSTNDLH